MTHPFQRTDEILPATFLSLHGLAERGLTRHSVARLVADGRLIRLRNGRYVHTGTHADLVSAGRLGGRLDCVSLLTALGVFVRAAHPLHVQFEPGTDAPAATARCRRTLEEVIDGPEGACH